MTTERKRSALEMMSERIFNLLFESDGPVRFEDQVSGWELDKDDRDRKTDTMKVLRAIGAVEDQEDRVQWLWKGPDALIRPPVKYAYLTRSEVARAQRMGDGSLVYTRDDAFLGSSNQGDRYDVVLEGEIGRKDIFQFYETSRQDELSSTSTANTGPSSSRKRKTTG